MSNILIIESRFYSEIANISLETTKLILSEHNLNYDVISVPGAFEISSALNIALEVSDYEGVIVLGCVIKGETDHYQLIINECTRTIHDISIGYSLPLGFGLIAAHNIMQAEKRAIEYARRASIACIELMNIKSKFYSLDKDKNIIQ